MLDTVLVPKVGSASDVEFVATLLDQIEQRNGWEPGRIGIHILIETAKGMANVESIARARPDRLEAMVFGVADYAASVQARTTNIGGANPDYAVLTDADVDGVRVPTGEISGTSGSRGWSPPAAPRVCARSTGRSGTSTTREGYRSAARRAAALGCEGKWAIHPSQIALANEVFTPAAAEVQRADRILQAMEDGAKEGKGAVSLDGRLIDAASIRMAQNLMTKVEQMRAR